MRPALTTPLATLLLAGTALAGPYGETRFPGDASVIDVTDPMWGVIPNDGKDDSAALQRLFDLMTPSSKVVYFPDGRYDLSREVILRKRDYAAEAEALEHEGWTERTEGGRTFLVAERTASTPKAAGRITYRFDGISGNRRIRFSYRFPDEGANRFSYRLNGGAWREAGRAGDGAWRDDAVFADGVRVETGENVLEIAVGEAGVEIDAVRLDYGSAYLADTIIQGQSRRGTVLRLSDGLTGGDGAPFGGAALAWEPGVEQLFRTAVRSLTIDVGRNNPEADGLRFHGNNQSTVADVLIRAPAGSGDVGLDLAHTAAIGPILVRDLQVRGFDVGVHAG